MLVSVPDSESEHALVLMIHKAAGDSRNDFLNWCSFLSTHGMKCNTTAKVCLFVHVNQQLKTGLIFSDYCLTDFRVLCGRQRVV